MVRRCRLRFKADITSISDFPSLSGGPRPQQSNNANTGWNSNAIRQPAAPPLSQTQSIQQRAPSAAPSQQSLDQFDGQRAQQQASERSGGDDFPPLGGQANGDVFASTNGLTGGVGSPDGQPRMNGQQSQLPIRENGGSFQSFQQQQTAAQSQRQSSQTESAPPMPSRVKKYSEMTESEKWGLPGLMAAFESRRQVDNGGQADDSLPPLLRNSVIMGHDLESLGLDLGTSDSLYPTFTPFQAIGSSGSTFDFHERHMIPDFTLPSAYTVTNVPEITTRMSAFSDGKPQLPQTSPSPTSPRLTLLPRNALLHLLPRTPLRHRRTRRHRTQLPRMALAQTPPPMAAEGHRRRAPRHLLPAPHRPHQRRPHGPTTHPHERDCREGRIRLLRCDELAAREEVLGAGL